MGRKNDRKTKRKKKKFLFVGLPPSTCNDELEMGVFIMPADRACANTAEHAIVNMSKD